MRQHYVDGHRPVCSYHDQRKFFKLDTRSINNLCNHLATVYVCFTWSPFISSL